jgi:hypothetical protein
MYRQWMVGGQEVNEPGGAANVLISKAELAETDACSGVWTDSMDALDSDVECSLKLSTCRCV